MVRASLKASARVRKKGDFDRARKRGRSFGDDVLRFTVLDNGLAVTRLGLAIAKRASAVERNRIKRVVREVFRLRRSTLPAGLDLVVSARDFGKAVDFAAVSRSFDALAARLPGGG
jgi:ribonuclease P protein component